MSTPGENTFYEATPYDAQFSHVIRSHTAHMKLTSDIVVETRRQVTSKLRPTLTNPGPLLYDDLQSPCADSTLPNSNSLPVPQPNLTAHVKAAIDDLISGRAVPLSGERFILYWDEPPTHGGNAASALMARALVQSRHSKSYTKSDIPSIDAAIYQRLSYFRKAHTRQKATSSPVFHNQLIFDRRQRITTDPKIPALHKHSGLIQALGVEAVSDDESEDPQDRSCSRFLTVRKHWLSPEVSKLTASLDNAYSQHYEPLRFSRRPSGRVKWSDRVVPGLPINAYDPEWLATLDNNQRYALRPSYTLYDFTTAVRT